MGDVAAGDPDLVRRVLATWAANHDAFGRAIAAADPSWGTDLFEMSTGIAALHGVGLYVNGAFAVGIERPLTAGDIDELERRSDAVGVTAAIEVGPLTHPDSVALLDARGYRAGEPLMAFRYRAGDPPPAPAWLEFASADGARLAEWQATAAAGWGYLSDTARRASDTYAAAAAAVDGPGLTLAIDRDRGEIVGCASVTITGGVATLGGMSTLPAFRRRGVQAALIAHRVRRALGAGCDLIVSSAKPGSGSARNLVRHGLAPLFERTMFERTMFERTMFERTMSGPGDRPGAGTARTPVGRSVDRG